MDVKLDMGIDKNEDDDKEKKIPIEIDDHCGYETAQPDVRLFRRERLIAVQYFDKENRTCSLGNRMKYWTDPWDDCHDTTLLSVMKCEILRIVGMGVCSMSFPRLPRKIHIQYNKFACP